MVTANTRTNGALPQTVLTITAPKFVTWEARIRGSAPLVMNRFSAKARNQIMATQEQGSRAKTKKARAARDFEADYLGAAHVSTEGWYGIPAASFRNAMISACRVAGFVMTKAKLAVFVEPDGFEREDATPLVRITKGEPRRMDAYVRNETGVIDVRSRPLWDPGWEARPRITFDSDVLSAEDIANLMMRVGLQVGLGEGRPDSKKSNGLGYGLFQLVNDD